MDDISNQELSEEDIEIQEAIKVVNDYIKNRNRMTVVEFEQFKALYDEEELKLLTPEQRRSLGNRFYNSFSLQDPIIVTHLNGEVAFTLAPVLMPTQTFNSVKTDIISTYNAALDLSDPLRRHDKVVAKQMKDIINNLVPEDVKTKYGELQNKINSQTVFTPNEFINSTTDDHDLKPDSEPATIHINTNDCF